MHQLLKIFLICRFPYCYRLFGQPNQCLLYIQTLDSIFIFLNKYFLRDPKKVEKQYDLSIKIWHTICRYPYHCQLIEFPHELLHTFSEHHVLAAGIFHEYSLEPSKSHLDGGGFCDLELLTDLGHDVGGDVATPIGEDVLAQSDVVYHLIIF